MINISKLLLESLNLYKCEVLIKTSTDKNKVYIYNEIRGLKGVVVVTVEQNDFLDKRKTDEYEYSLIHIKFISPNTPELAIKEIRRDALITSKISGLKEFIPRVKTIVKKEQY